MVVGIESSEVNLLCAIHFASYFISLILTGLRGFLLFTAFSQMKPRLRKLLSDLLKVQSRDKRTQISSNILVTCFLVPYLLSKGVILT